MKHLKKLINQSNFSDKEKSYWLKKLSKMSEGQKIVLEHILVDNIMAGTSLSDKSIKKEIQTKKFLFEKRLKFAEKIFGKQGAEKILEINRKRTIPLTDAQAKELAGILSKDKKKAFEFFMLIGPDGMKDLEHKMFEAFKSRKIKPKIKEFKLAIDSLKKFRTASYRISEKYEYDKRKLELEEQIKAERKKQKNLKLAQKKLFEIAKKHKLQIK